MIRERFGGWLESWQNRLITTLTLLTALGGALVFFSENKNLSIGVLVILANGVAIAFILSVAFARTNSPLVLPAELQIPRFRFSRGLRVLALFLSLAIPIASFQLYEALSYPRKTGKFRVMFARLNALSDDSTKLDQTIFQFLKETLQSAPDTELLWHDQSLSIDSGEQEVQALAVRADADLVIWGWHVSSPTSVLVTIKLANQTTTNIEFPPIGTPGKNIVRPIGELQNFALQLELNRDIAALIFAVRALDSAHKGDWTGVTAFYDQAVQQAPKVRSQIEQSLGLFNAYALLKTHRLGEADEILTRLIKNQCCPYTTRMLRANVHIVAGNHETALDDLKAASQLMPRDCAPHLLRGFLYAGTGRFAQGIEEHQHAPTSTECADGALANLTWIYLLRRQYDVAEATASRYAHLYPDESLPYLRRAEARFHQGRLQETLSDLRIASSKGLQSSTALLLEGKVARRKGDDRLAIRRLSSAIQEDSTSHEAFTERAQALLSVGQEAAAERDVSRAVSILHSERAALLQGSKEHLLAGRIPLSEFDRLRAEYISSELGRALILRASIRRQLSLLDSADKDFDSALRLAKRVLPNGLPYFHSTLAGM